MSEDRFYSVYGESWLVEHGDGFLEINPRYIRGSHPREAFQPREIVMVTEEGGAKIAYLVFSREEVRRILGEQHVLAVIGNPAAFMVPESSHKHTLRLLGDYGEYFLSMAECEQRFVRKEECLLFNRLSAGMRSFIPDRPEERYGIVIITDLSGRNYVYLYPSVQHFVELMGRPEVLNTLSCVESRREGIRKVGERFKQRSSPHSMVELDPALAKWVAYWHRILLCYREYERRDQSGHGEL